MIELHTDIETERFEIALMQIKNSFFSELWEEILIDLAIYLQCYGSKTDIEEMEEKYDFNYHETLKKKGYEI